MTRGSRISVPMVLAGAAVLGGAVGGGSALTTGPERADVAAVVRGAAVATGLRRRRPPQPGDRWEGCNAPRALGTAPIYRGEPGYSPNMDGDDDGVACE